MAKIYKFDFVDALMVVLAVDVAAVRERHCAAAFVCGGVVFAACVKTAMHILNKVFDSGITLLASFVTAVDN